MIASILSLTRADINALRMTDAYSLHRVVYDLFEDIRSEAQKQASIPSGILYADKGGDFNSKKIIILSNRPVKNITHGQIQSKIIPDSFLLHDRYRFEVTLNPTKRDKHTGKIVAIRGRETIAKWFVDKAEKSWGFIVKPENLQVGNVTVKNFEKKGQHVTQGSATLIGEFLVSDREKFINSFQEGIGRGRAFGFGLLQIVPLQN